MRRNTNEVKDKLKQTLIIRIRKEEGVFICEAEKAVVCTLPASPSSSGKWQMKDNTHKNKNLQIIRIRKERLN